MDKVDIQLPQAAKKMESALLNAMVENEIKFGVKTGELVVATLDIFYCVSEGKLWNMGSIGMDLDSGEIFKDGTYVQFVPSPIKHATTAGERHSGIFTLSIKKGSPIVAATLGIETTLTEKGHTNVEGHATGSNEITLDKIATGVAALGLGTVREFRLPS